MEIADPDDDGSAYVSGDEWVCVCGTGNPLDWDQEYQNCSECHRNRDFVLEKYGQPEPDADAEGRTEPSDEAESGPETCPYCGSEVDSRYPKCKQCGEWIRKPDRSSTRRTAGSDQPEKSDTMAGCLGLLLGPVGLWYKGHWPAGFAWLVMALLLGALSGGWLAPVLWIGMAVHAALAEPQ